MQKMLLKLMIAIFVGVFALVINIPETTVYFSIFTIATSLIIEMLYECYKYPLKYSRISLRQIVVVIIISLLLFCFFIYILFLTVIAFSKMKNNKVPYSSLLQNECSTLGLIVIIIIIAFTLLYLLVLYYFQTKFLNDLLDLSYNQKKCIKNGIKKQLIKIGFSKKDVKQLTDYISKEVYIENYISNNFSLLRTLRKILDNNSNKHYKSFYKKRLNYIPIKLESNKYCINANAEFNNFKKKEIFEYTMDNVDELFDIKIIYEILTKVI
ncbi:hypothetical protein [Apilactobacillus xinyiensis]|uniref:hypothetical protein n=1 Tax=Apilactobacillus xinyiensis TaxID=2841032 RepID=UPI00200CBD24|nr:hypothetical protein [Apilactobacillus xinyiensis]MCL0330548.1 hypothetical protein [Apilactobacillus xinyiensis]